MSSLLCNTSSGWVRSQAAILAEPTNYAHENALQQGLFKPECEPLLCYFATGQDRKLRAISRNSDPAHVEALREAFSTWILKRFGGEVEASTPSKGKWEGDRSAGARKRKLEL